MPKKPSTNHLAQLTSGSYTMGDKGTKAQRLKKTKKEIEDVDNMGKTLNTLFET